MSSACRRARSAWLLPLALALASGAGCEQQQRPAASVAPPAIDVAIGPTPGPEPDAPGTDNPFKDDKMALGEGRRFFVAYNCAGCHGDHGGGGMGPSLRDEAWLYGSSHAQVADSIARGRAHGMPAWQKMLTPAQIWQLTAYIKSMRTAHEPQPPL